jgi:hypothetical protein
VKKRFFSLAFLAIAAIGCNYPYSPKEQPSVSSGSPPDTSTSSQSGSSVAGKVYRVNTGWQVCNPSISESDAYYGCMLWLGFGQYNVNVPDSLSGYTLSGATHDRLTISDTGNNVRWFLMLSGLDNKEDISEFQCPRWSANPCYISCLAGKENDDGLDYSGFIVRLSDHKSLEICSKKLEEFSAPHSWLPDSLFTTGITDSPSFDTNGFVLKQYVVAFLGTSDFKYAYSIPGNTGTLYYIDYSEDNPVPVALNKPSGKESWYCANPQISPDGNWVAYHCYSNAAKGNYYYTYIQKLSPSSEPVLVASSASDPHWWVNKYDNDAYNIVYCFTNGSYFSEYDYTDTAVENSGGAGATVMQRLKGTWKDAPGYISLQPDNSYSADTLVKLPFKGGLSSDGYFLCTAYKYAYIMRLK